MATPVIMPRQGQSVESCILTEWKVAPGDQVEEGSVLAVIETDKASFDLESPVRFLICFGKPTTTFPFLQTSRSLEMRVRMRLALGLKWKRLHPDLR